MKRVPIENFKQKLTKKTDDELLREEGKLRKYRNLGDYNTAIDEELVKRGLRDPPKVPKEE